MSRMVIGLAALVLAGIVLAGCQPKETQGQTPSGPNAPSSSSVGNTTTSVPLRQ